MRKNRQEKRLKRWQNLSLSQTRTAMLKYIPVTVKEGQLSLKNTGNGQKNRTVPADRERKNTVTEVVLKMPVPDWIDYIIRKAGRQKKYYLDLQEEQQNIYRVEKLTVTEQMVMQYLEKGYTNAEISQIMNIKLPTVKSHI